MFPLDFPLGQLERHPDARRVLDPFCGRGTTLYAARLTGRQAVGIDINPVAVAIACAKTVQASPAAVVRLARRFMSDADEAAMPQGEFWEWGFHPRTLREVVALRAGLRECTDAPAAKLLRALLLGVLHGPRNKGTPSYLSNQMPRTYASKPAYAVRYWRKHELRPVRVDTMDVIERRAERVLAGCPPRTPGRVVLGDAASSVMALRQRFDLVITSPPYYGMRTYVADQWLRNWFVGGPSEVPYGSGGQITRQPSQTAFVSALAQVWRTVANRCTPEGRLVIRFGALPSAKASPEKLQIQDPAVLPRFDIQQLKSRRSFVFARAGFGKSNLVKLLFANLYGGAEGPVTEKRGGRKVPVGTIVFDPDGEYYWPDDKGRPGLCDVPQLQDRLAVFTYKEGDSDFYRSFVVDKVKLDRVIVKTCG
jgi:predicted RNA methylase